MRLLPYFDAYVVGGQPRELLYPGAAATRALVPSGQAGNYPVLGLAMHMLYHVPDIRAAIGELRRVVKPGGMVLASTNSAGTLAEVHSLYRSGVFTCR